MGAWLASSGRGRLGGAGCRGFGYWDWYLAPLPHALSLGHFEEAIRAVRTKGNSSPARIWTTRVKAS